MSQLPVTESISSRTVLNELVSEDMTMRVNITSASIANVSPVRSRELRGYAMAVFNEGLILENRPSTAVSAFVMRSALYMTTQTAAATMQMPDMKNISMLDSKSGTIQSSESNGTPQCKIRARPMKV